MNDNKNNFDLSHQNNIFTGILDLIVDEITMSKEHLIQIEYNRLGENSQAIILCNIIYNWLSLNYLSRILVEEALHHIITNKGNQYRNRSDQFLLYIKGKRRVGKSRVIKVIYLGFCFLRRQKKLVITTPTRFAIANIAGAIINGALSIDNSNQVKI